MRIVPLTIQIAEGTSDADLRSELSAQLEVLARHVRDRGIDGFGTTGIRGTASKVTIDWKREKEE